MTTIRVANLAYQMGGDQQLLRDLRDGAGADEPADVLALIEARDWHNQPVDVPAALGRRFLVSQDRTSGATAGSVLAVRRGAAHLRWAVRTLLSRRARRVQNRYQRAGAIGARRRTRRLNVVHLPLKSTGQQPDAVAAILRWVEKQRRAGKPWMVLGDFNMHHDELRRLLGAPHSFGADVMGAVWSHGWGHVETSSRRYRGSDHAVLTLTTQEK